MGTQGEAVRATRVTLQTLGERLQAGEATDLAGPLPIEIDYYLTTADHGQRFDDDEFLARVSLLAEVVSGREIEQVRNQLPDDEDWETLFELVGAGKRRSANPNSSPKTSSYKDRTKNPKHSNRSFKAWDRR
jgi:uncharacterized protein (DUF2267 family)